MKLRPQQRRLSWPPTPTQWEGVDEMLETLFKTVRQLTASAASLTGVLDVTHGGTGLNSVAKGDILYGSAPNVLSRLAFVATPTRYLANTGAGVPQWDLVNLANGTVGILPSGSLPNPIPLANLPSQAASTLLGRGTSGAGVPQVIVLGTNLSMTGTTLNAVGGTSSIWSVLTNGVPAAPELIFDSFGDVIMTSMP